MKVLATKQGVYNQILREPGEVFSLLTYPDGSFPKAQRFAPKLDAKGNRDPSGEGTWIEVKDKKTNQPIHRDFAEDVGSKSIKSGNMAGENFEIGWMKPVPETVAEGFYPPGTDFRSGVMIPQAIPRDIGPGDKRAATILTHLTPEAEDAA